MQLPRKMSAQNVMASISRTLGNRESKQSVANEIRFAGDERKDKLYEPKHKQKLVRVLTVVAYVIFVSLAAILLSLYYTFLWDPQDASVRTMRINKQECGTPKVTEILTFPPISNETQIEKMVGKSTTTDAEVSEGSNTIDVPREKGLLEILTTVTETKTSSTTFPTTESGDLLTETTTTIKDKA